MKMSLYIITKVLDKVGRIIETVSSKHYKVNDIVSKQDLLNFAEKEGLTYSISDHSNIITISDLQNTIHIVAFPTNISE